MSRWTGVLKEMERLRSLRQVIERLENYVTSEDRESSREPNKQTLMHWRSNTAAQWSKCALPSDWPHHPSGATFPDLFFSLISPSSGWTHHSSFLVLKSERHRILFLMIDFNTVTRREGNNYPGWLQGSWRPEFVREGHGYLSSY